MTRKGVILAGGSGTRLNPLTLAVSKQILPVYDKPMVYYPLTTLMLAGIREILLISTARDLPRFEELLGDGSQWGLTFTYSVQDQPRGIADAFLIGEGFIGDSPVALVLGDNLFFGHGLTGVLAAANQSREWATIFTYRVKNPERYGVVQLTHDGSISQIVEKPVNPPSRLAVTGLYFYPPGVVEVARRFGPSSRGELEITAVNNWYLDQGLLHMQVLHRGFAWLDTGTHEALHQASSFVQTVQERQGLLVASPDEIAWRLGYIDTQALLVIAKTLGASDYAVYLEGLLEEAGDGSDNAR